MTLHAIHIDARLLPALTLPHEGGGNLSSPLPWWEGVRGRGRRFDIREMELALL